MEDDLLGFMRQRRLKQEAIWRPLVDAILAAPVPRTTATACALIGAVLGGGHGLGPHRDALERCGVEFGRAADFVGTCWSSDGVRCVALSPGLIRSRLLYGNHLGRPAGRGNSTNTRRDPVPD